MSMTLSPTQSRSAEIGSQADNRAFLAFLVEHGDVDMIRKGCCLCRAVGHPFDVACQL